jgi:predicted HicB family RNase H-like nuclease
MIKYKGYAGVVELDEESEVFFGRVIGLRDVITFQGSSVAEVIQAFHGSVDDYLEFCAERGESPEKPYSGQFVLRVDPRLHGAMARAAEAQSTSLNALIEDTLERTFGTPKPKDQEGPAHKSAPHLTKKRAGQSRRTTVQKTAASAAFVVQKPGKSKGPKVPKSNKTVKG